MDWGRLFPPCFRHSPAANPFDVETDRLAPGPLLIEGPLQGLAECRVEMAFEAPAAVERTATGFSLTATLRGLLPEGGLGDLGTLTLKG
jgi:hypothetical protein